MNYYIVNLTDEEKEMKKKSTMGLPTQIYLLKRPMDFFENRQFNKDIVDILVKVTSDALGINIYIYQKERDKETQKRLHSMHEKHVQ